MALIRTNVLSPAASQPLPQPTASSAFTSHAAATASATAVSELEEMTVASLMMLSRVVRKAPRVHTTDVAAPEIAADSVAPEPRAAETFVCTACARSFDTFWALDWHEEIHRLPSRAALRLCDICFRNCESYSALRMHKRRWHAGQNAGMPRRGGINLNRPAPVE